MQSNAQRERLDYLLHAFKEDSGRYRDLETGESYEEKRMALRSPAIDPLTMPFTVRQAFSFGKPVIVR